ncbi:MAG: hypothetical protein JSU83_08695 [Deltaproteobacteria bacterium]|nr:MAG: hypothetical protein JSU83_08695 [Deltaproteobacteria bacterium]
MVKPLIIKVDCYAGYRGEETPRYIRLGERKIAVLEVIDQWLAPDHRYFKIQGDDGAIYIIRHDIDKRYWELIFYTQTNTSDLC